MYDKIAQVMNRDHGCSDISSEEVENYLRHGEMKYISSGEAMLIDWILEDYL